jgi:predicted membrane chloride channel (bestrophin family)
MVSFYIQLLTNYRNNSSREENNRSRKENGEIMATNRELELNRQAKLDALEQHLIGLINAYQSINCKLDEILGS